MRAGSPPTSGSGSKVSASASTTSNPSRIMRRDLGEGGQATGIALDGDDLAGTGSEDRPRQPAGSGPTSIDGRVLEVPAERAMRLVRLRSNRKFWPSDFLASEAVLADHIAQGRQIVDLAHGRWHAVSRRAASFIAAIEAVGPGDALASDVEGGAVVGRGAHEGQPERDVHRRRRRPAS